ncbi:SGNH hydrolase [Corynespora cassiicola Philippines]|uniref:SGNH hydrolase n=1 Tax=Corynespora cassiicola Philippines TaxID=1448308 RepID=A0A2T2NXQ1_CORCC|nr:SGNH hydrolase [Corynespora cassiicola Philippines]
MLCRASLALLALAALLIFSSTTNGRTIDKRQDGHHWINTWTSMPQLVEPNNMPPSQFTSGAVLRDATLRQTLHLSVGTPKIKIAISNTFGGSDLPITAGSVALPVGGAAGVSGIQASPLAAITVGGKASFTVPKGQVVVSDEIAFEVKPQSMITVSLYSQAGQSGSAITGHPGSRTTSWFVQGNRVNATTISGTQSVHWYFISAIQAYVPTDTHSLVILGDSLTDGRGSDDNKNNRWPDLLLSRLHSSPNPNHTKIAICNQAAGGNRVLKDGLGPSLLSRYSRDALTQPGTKWLLIFEGVNDIGNEPTSPAAQTAVGSALMSAFEKIAGDARAAGAVAVGATIAPFGAPSAALQGYSDPERERTRRRVNEWILGSGVFDHVVDFGGVLESKSTPGQLDQRFNGGDYLHPNGVGYKALADAFPLDIFHS